MNKADLGPAGAAWDGSRLVLSTGETVREWALTARGLKTYRFCAHSDNRNWIECEESAVGCDWQVFAMTDDLEPELEAVELKPVTDDFTGMDFIKVLFDFAYKDSGLALRYMISVYPGAPGFRTQIMVKALKNFATEDMPGYLGGSFSEKLCVSPWQYTRLAAGYYNDTQHRNRDETPILREETCSGIPKGVRREVYDQANLVALEKDGHGLVLLKESHKCVNQPGIDTGAFVLESDNIRVTGLGLTPEHYLPRGPWMAPGRFRKCWASWSILYRGSESDRQHAVKRFDRMRFEPEPRRRLRSRANTWGSRMAGDHSRAAAEEKNVLREIESCADLGIDALAIDDGWQCDPRGMAHTSEHDWRPHPERFPEGWKTVREAAKAAGVQLDLWIPGSAGAEQMILNLDEGEFNCYKIDFLRLDTPEKIEALLDKIRSVIRHSGYRVHISWDATENSPRMGYFFGREFGSLYPENRKPSPDKPRIRHVVYVPRLVFRDAWHLSHYINLNQIEITIQNIDRIRPQDSNAAMYSHAYCTALALMGLPLFFQETQMYDENARKQIRPVIQAYRRNREEIASGIVFPAGDEPCDRAWSGFQSHRSETGTGYLTMFREIYSDKSSCAVKVHMLDGAGLEIEDVFSGSIRDAEVGSDGRLPLRIEEPGGFLFLRYRIK